MAARCQPSGKISARLCPRVPRGARVGGQILRVCGMGPKRVVAREAGLRVWVARAGLRARRPARSVAAHRGGGAGVRSAGQPRASGAGAWLLRGGGGGARRRALALPLWARCLRASAGVSQPSTLALTLGAGAMALPLILLSARTRRRRRVAPLLGGCALGAGGVVPVSGARLARLGAARLGGRASSTSFCCTRS